MKKSKTYGKLVGAESLLFIVCSNDIAIFHAICHSTRGGVILQRRPRTRFALLLVDSERLWDGSVEAQTHVRDVESLAQVKSEIDAVRVLHVLQHGLRLPPGVVSIFRRKVREETRRMRFSWVSGIANIALLSSARYACDKSNFVNTLNQRPLNWRGVFLHRGDVSNYPNLSAFLHLTSVPSSYFHQSLCQLISYMLSLKGIPV